jgi:hypothetical protein
MRIRAERPKLGETIETSVKADSQRREVTVMQRTIADDLRDKGRKQGRKEGALQTRRATLIRQLQRRFDELPDEIVRKVNQTDDPAQLDAWLDRVVDGASLHDLDIS